DEQRAAIADQLAELEPKLAALQEQWEAKRRENVERMLDEFGEREIETDQRIDVVLESGETIPLTDAQPTQPVVEVQLVRDGAAPAWAGFRKFHGEIRERFHEREHLQKHDSGEIDERMNDARLSVRQAELDFNVIALPAAEELTRLDTQLEALEQAKAEADEAVAAIVELAGKETPLATLAEQLGRSIKVRIDEEMRKPRDRIAELRADLDTLPAPVVKVVDEYLATQSGARRESAEVQQRIERMRDENLRYELRVETVDGTPSQLALDDVVRAYPANQLGLFGKLGVYGSRWIEFLTDKPRDSNNAGGVFPAIWGTVAMTLIMAILVVPFGVLAALYLREYAKGGLIISVIRISINNLAGVPSIVFGVFGFTFFCYTVGAYIDRGPAGAEVMPWPPRIWYVALFVLAICGTAGFVFGISSLSSNARARRGWQTWLRRIAFASWIVCFSLAVMLIAKSPFFDGFFAAYAPNPKFGTGGLLWASLTLALLTLPVVIVATEEALSAVPNSLREGSYACGASKWQTIRRIILPHAMPGIMTGMILAMARGAGEVAPLMLVGAVKLAPDLPVDMSAPFVHLERSFMHLGFHIFDLGFQSQNSEASQPVMFTTTLLLIVLIAALNIMAIALRNRLRRRFQASQF
ncbi:MAG: ABC transporter permease subunit, partial [Planctomycetales bacterium]|nr:ABC transporter permease subunit [Planctomycetales bacterium]